MKILGIESSSLVASVAIVTDELVTAEYTVNYKKNHSQTLLPMLDEIVRMTEQDLDTVDAIAVSGGPGSFTGLRIGAATAKGLGLALNKPLIHVPTVDAMAYSLYGCAHLICPLMDARRSQVYTGLYTFEDAFQVVEKNAVMVLDALLDRLEVGEPEEAGDPKNAGAGEVLAARRVVFLGDGVPVSQERILERLGERAMFAPAPCNRQRAASVAALGALYWEKGLAEPAETFAPAYLRPSQAERVRAERAQRQT